MDNLSDFGFLVNAMGGDRGGDGDAGSIFPRSDATDLGNGARFIPGEVRAIIFYKSAIYDRRAYMEATQPES